MTRKEAQRLVDNCLAEWIGKDAIQCTMPCADLTRYADPDRPGPIVSKGNRIIVRFL